MSMSTEEEISILDQVEQLNFSDTGSLPTAEVEEFYNTLERYQSEARDIQEALQNVHNKYSEISGSQRLSPKIRVEIQENQQLMEDLKDKLEKLEDENRQISMQMRNIANLSGISSMSMGSYVRSPTSNINSPSSLTISQLSPHVSFNKTPASTPRSTVKNQLEKSMAEVVTLKQQLKAERQKNEMLANENKELKREMKKMVNIVDTQKILIMNRVSKKINEQVEKMEKCSAKVVDVMVKERYHSESLRSLRAEFATQKTAIESIMKSYQGVLFQYKLKTVNAISSVSPRSPKRSSPSKSVSEVDAALFDSPRNYSKKSVLTTPRKTPLPVSNSRSSIKSQHSPTIDSKTKLLARGCEEIADFVNSKFGGQNQNVLDIVVDPALFGKYISNVRYILETGVARLENELSNTQNDLEIALDKIESQKISPEVVDLVGKVILSINGISDQMDREYNDLISRLE